MGKPFRGAKSRFLVELARPQLIYVEGGCGSRGATRCTRGRVRSPNNLQGVGFYGVNAQIWAGVARIIS